MRLTLNIDTPSVFCQIERLERALLTKSLGLIDVLITAVVSGARVPLGILVLHNTAERIENSLGGEVLRGNEVDEVALALLLALEDAVDFRVILGEVCAEKLHIN
jgi:hypothetical protein